MTVEFHMTVVMAFPALSTTTVISHDFPGLENSFLKFHNFPGCVGTLHSESANLRQTTLIVGIILLSLGEWCHLVITYET